MKKNTLLQILFISLFFVGNIYADDILLPKDLAQENSHISYTPDTPYSACTIPFPTIAYNNVLFSVTVVPNKEYCMDLGTSKPSKPLMTINYLTSAGMYPMLQVTYGTPDNFIGFANFISQAIAPDLKEGTNWLELGDGDYSCFSLDNPLTPEMCPLKSES